LSGAGELGSERALVLAPRGRDAAIAAALLQEAGIAAHVCRDIPGLVQEIARGAGLAVVTDEAFGTSDLKDLSDWIANQPPWSDFPFVLLTNRGGGVERNPAAARLSGVLGNATFLERPFHPTTLVSLARTALRGRRRQYEARAMLLDLAAERARFQAAIENMPVGVGLVEPDGTVILANPAFQAILPDAKLPSAHEDAERHWIAHDPEGRPLPRSAFPGARALRGEHVQAVEFQHVRAGGSQWYRISGIPVRDPAGGVSGALLAIVDIDQEKRAAEHQNLLINELNHRVKNTLATVQSISAQTLRNADTTAEAREAVEMRLLALSRAHDVLTRENWEGASLIEVVAQAVEPYRTPGADRLHAAGPDVRLPPRMALALAMALQELATNAVKYGALSNDRGTVRITWSVRNGAVPPRLALRWSEREGPRVEPPQRRGFGSRLIERSLAQDLDGTVQIDFAPTGVVCLVDAPIQASP
jgi:two-component sensor histidine kinase/PAS domain-containing protein